MTDLRAIWIALLLALAGILLYHLAPVMTPFLIAALLAYVFNPLVTRLEALRMPRTLSVLLLFVLLAGLLGALVLWLVPLLQARLTAFAGRLPEYLDAFQQTILPWLKSILGEQAALLDVASLKDRVIEHWQEIGRAGGEVFATLTQSGMRVAGWVMTILLVPVVAFYLLRDWNRIVLRVQQLFPVSMQPKLAQLARETDLVLGGFLRGQLSVMLALGVIYSTGLWLIDLDLALPIGVVSGLVSFVPYLGFIVGLGMAGVAALFQFQDAWMLLWVLAVFGVGQVLDATFLTPTLVGDRVGLHPVAVIFALLAGGQLFGFMGVLLALPVAAVLLVWLRHAHDDLLRERPAVARKPRRRP